MDQKIPVAIIHRRYPITTVMPRHVLKPLLPYIDGVILWCIHAWFVDLLGITLMLVHKDGLSWYNPLCKRCVIECMCLLGGMWRIGEEKM